MWSETLKDVVYVCSAARSCGESGRLTDAPHRACVPRRVVEQSQSMTQVAEHVLADFRTSPVPAVCPGL